MPPFPIAPYLGALGVSRQIGVPSLMPLYIPRTYLDTPYLSTCARGASSPRTAEIVTAPTAPPTARAAHLAHCRPRGHP